jgi:hypothetical protein
VQAAIISATALWYPILELVFMLIRIANGIIRNSSGIMSVCLLSFSSTNILREEVFKIMYAGTTILFF